MNKRKRKRKYFWCRTWSSYITDSNNIHTQTMHTLDHFYTQRSQWNGRKTENNPWNSTVERSEFQLVPSWNHFSKTISSWAMIIEIGCVNNSHSTHFERGLNVWWMCSITKYERKKTSTFVHVRVRIEEETLDHFEVY